MTDSNPTSSRSASLLNEALERYLSFLEDGSIPDRNAFLDEYPEELRFELSECIDGLAFVEQLAPDLRGSPKKPHMAGAMPIKELGDYRIIGEIGRGGMGVVYEAHQISLGRKVALKVLPFASLLDERQLRRFKNEARAAASLRHPNIVQVHGVGYERSVHFYAMDLIDGHDLSRAIEELHRGPDAVAEADTKPIAKLSTEISTSRSDFFRSVARLGVQAAEALQFAHEEGVIHRDIKPANLLLDHRGQLLITDFGLARVQTNEDLTLTGDQIGTLRYMSPEQLDSSKLTDHRTDIYSLGLTLYEVLSGCPAFPETNRASLTKAIVEESPKRPRQLDANIPADLETIVLHSISRSPNDRYQSAQAFADDLGRFLDKRPVNARRPSQWRVAWHWCVRNPMFAASLLLLVLAISCGFLASSVQLSRAMMAEQMTREELYASEIRGAYEAWARDDIAQAALGVTKYSGQPSKAENNLELKFLANKIADIDSGAVISCYATPRDLELSPDGMIVVAIFGDGTLQAWNTASTELLWQHATTRDWVVRTEISNDGEFIAYQNGQSIDLRRLDNGARVAAIQTSNEKQNPHTHFFQFSDDSKSIVYLDQRDVGKKRLVKRGGAKFEMLLSSQPVDDRMWQFELSPDGKTFGAIGNDQKSIWIGSTDDMQLTAQLGEHASRVETIYFSHDGKTMFTGRGAQEAYADTRLRIWNTSMKKEIYPLPSDETTGLSAIPSPTSDCIATFGHTPNTFHIVDLKSNIRRKMRGHRARIQCVTWNKAGSHLASACLNNEIRVWQDVDVPEFESQRNFNRISFAHSEHTAYVAVEDPVTYGLASEITAVEIPTGAQRSLTGTNNSPIGIAMLRDGNLVFGTIGGTAYSVDKSGGQTMLLLKTTGTGGYSDLVYSSKRDLIATAVYSFNDILSIGRVEFWQREGSAWTNTRSVQTSSWPMSLALSPNEDLLCAGLRDGKIQIWDLNNGSERSIQSSHEITKIRFSGSGQLIVTTGLDGNAFVWDTHTGSQTSVLPHFQEVHCAEFSPDENRLVTGCRQGWIYIWDWRNKRLMGSMQFGRLAIGAIAFSSDGKTLFTVSSNGELSQHSIGPQHHSVPHTLSRAKNEIKTE